MGLQPMGWRGTAFGHLVLVERHDEGVLLTLAADLRNGWRVDSVLTAGEAMDLGRWLVEQADAPDERPAATGDG